MTREQLTQFVREWPKSEEGRRMLAELRWVESVCVCGSVDRLSANGHCA